VFIVFNASSPTDEGLGSSGGGGKRFGSLGSGSADSGSVYLSDSQDWAVSPGCSPEEGPAPHSVISPVLAEEAFRYMSKSHFGGGTHTHTGFVSVVYRSRMRGGGQ